MAVTSNGFPVPEDRFWSLDGRPMTSDEKVWTGFDWSKDPPVVVNGNRLFDAAREIERPAWEALVASSRKSSA